jgi:hypothetical protein
LANSDSEMQRLESTRPRVEGLELRGLCQDRLFTLKDVGATGPVIGASPPATPRGPCIRDPQTSGRFREDQPSLEAAATPHDRGNKHQAPANLFHDTVDNGEPKTTAGADRGSANERLLQGFEGLQRITGPPFSSRICWLDRSGDTHLPLEMPLQIFGGCEIVGAV